MSNSTFRGKIDSLNSALLISKRRYSGAKIALHFRSQNGCDNSTFRGRNDSLNSALLILKRHYSGAKMALYFRSRNGLYNSTFRGGIDFLNSALSMSKRRHRRAKMALNLRSWNGSQYQYFLGLICLWMRANLTFFFSQIAPIFSKTSPPKDQNGSVVFYFGPSTELKWPYTRRAESPLRGRRLIGAVLTPKKDLFCGQRFGPNFGVVSALLNLQCKLVISTCLFASVDSLRAENLFPDLLSSPITI